jgi:hypothetical protein
MIRSIATIKDLGYPKLKRSNPAKEKSLLYNSQRNVPEVMFTSILTKMGVERADFS